jgi:hypothetical protein
MRLDRLDPRVNLQSGKDAPKDGRILFLAEDPLSDFDRWNPLSSHCHGTAFS